MMTTPPKEEPTYKSKWHDEMHKLIDTMPAPKDFWVYRTDRLILTYISLPRDLPNPWPGRVRLDHAALLYEAARVSTTDLLARPDDWEDQAPKYGGRRTVITAGDPIWGKRVPNLNHDWGELA